MKESYECEVATHIGPESCGAAREGGVEALTGERAGRVFSRVRQLPRDASGSLGTYADDERTWEVGQTYCTGEVPEQRRATGSGGDGGKGSGQREPAPAKRVPDTEPGRRVQRVGAGTSSSKSG